MTRAILSVSLILMLALVAAPSVRANEPGSAFFDPDYFGSLRDEAAAASKAGQRGVLIMFEQDECPWCAKMMATVLSQPSVQQYYQKYFRAVHVDIKGDAPLTDFAGRELPQREFAFQHRVRATPVFMFFDTDGKLLTRFTGATRDVNEFLWLGEFVVNGNYKTQNFTAYKRERDAQKP